MSILKAGYAKTNITPPMGISISGYYIPRNADGILDELEATARLRLQHRDMSLSQLAALITPKISKPGLSHRLKKITELAKELLEIDDDE